MSWLPDVSVHPSALYTAEFPLFSDVKNEYAGMLPYTINQEVEELLIFHSKDHQITADGSKAVFWKML